MMGGKNIGVFMINVGVFGDFIVERGTNDVATNGNAVTYLPGIEWDACCLRILRKYIT